MNYIVLYWNPSATTDLRRIMEQEMPRGWRLMIPGQDGEAASLLPCADFMVVADRAVTAADLDAAERLRMIQHQGVGYERIDVASCKQRGVVLALTPEGTTTGVAEHTILLILALYKQLLRAATGVPRGDWLQWELRQNSFELSGKTVGLVGFGRIGRAVARRATAFDARVIYHDPLADDGAFERMPNLDALLEQSDIVSLHVPGSAGNRHMIGEQELVRMKPSALLINTSRGNLIDEAALYAALTGGQIAAAGLDVLAQEPPQTANPLLHLDNVLITPHISAGTADAFRAKMRAVFENLQRFASGAQPINVVPELT